MEASPPLLANPLPKDVVLAASHRCLTPLLLFLWHCSTLRIPQKHA